MKNRKGLTMKAIEIIETLQKLNPNTEIGLNTTKGVINDYCIKIELNNKIYFTEWEEDK